MLGGAGVKPFVAGRVRGLTARSSLFAGRLGEKAVARCSWLVKTCYYTRMGYDEISL